MNYPFQRTLIFLFVFCTNSAQVTYAYPNNTGNVYVAGGANPQFQTVYVGNQASQGFGHAAPLQTAPEGRWKDGLFDCCSNLWPSCGCLFVFSGVWLVAQLPLLQLPARSG